MSEVRTARLRAGGAQAIALTLRPDIDVEGVADSVATSLAAVRTRGDDALIDDIRRFDLEDFTHDRLRVPRTALERAVDALPEDLRTAIVAAASQVRVVAEALLPGDHTMTMPFGQRIRVRHVPVDSAGCYAPGGRAAYPSSLIMSVVPAQVAGVGRIVAVSPPGPDGRPSGLVLAAAGLLGVDEVYAAGGAAAIAALAYGTATIAAAPPAAYTSSTPSRPAAASTSGDGRPSGPGGLAATIRPTPATCAGTTLMMRLDGYAARPPGA